MMKRYLQISLILLNIFTQALPNDFSFSHLNVENGLSQSNVWAIYKDSKGFMWFGTDYGLNKFDGYEFTPYVHNALDSNSISYDIITCINQDSLEYLWIGTRHGLNRFDPNNETFERFFNDPDNKNSLSNNKIRKIFVDSKSRIWIAHSEGLDLFHPGLNSFTAYQDKLSNGHKLAKNGVFSIAEDERGNLWLGVNSLFRMDLLNDSLVYYDLGLPNDEVIYNYYTSNKKLWVATSGGKIFRYDEANDHFERIDSDLVFINYIVNVLGEDYNGNLMIGTDGGGAYILDDESSKVISLKHDPNDINSISNNTVASIFADEAGTIWIGNWRGGINYAHRFSNKFNHTKYNINDDNSLIGNNVRVISGGHDGAIWIGTAVGVSCWNKKNGTFHNFTVENTKNLLSNFITSIKEVSMDEIWIGTEVGGLVVYNKRKGTFTTYEIPGGHNILSSSSSVYCIQTDSYGNVWLGTSAGLFLINETKSKFTQYTPQNSKLPSNKIFCIYIDKEGILWFGTNLGFCRFDWAKNDFIPFIFYENNNSFYQQNINAFHEDKENNFWISTQGWGLILFDRETGKYKNLSMANGLPSNLISGILEDESGNLWISSTKGLTKFNIATRKIVKNYVLADGLQNLEFNPASFLKDSNGELYFGGINGITSFFPDSLIENPNIPPIVIIGFRIFNQSVKIGTKKSPLRKHISNSTELILKHNQNSISFDYVALNYIHPEKNLYSYQLEGYEDKWINAGTSRIASYGNLDPGDYIFKVKGSNNDGIWNEKGSSIRIEILPPWWKTWLAYLVYFLLFAFLIIKYGLFIKKREMEKNLIRHERLEKEKLKEINRMKLEFFTNISHEFRTPLNLIVGPAEDLIDYEKNDKFQNDRINLISRNAKRLISLVNDLMTFRKLENNLLKLQLNRGNLVAFVKDVVENFRPLASKQNIDLQFQSEETNIAYLFDQSRLEEVISNLLSNAIKYTSSEGEISVGVSIKGDEKMNRSKNSSSSDNFIEIIVSDTGIGIPEKEIPRIFERFYQVHRSKSSRKMGSGIGLTIVKALVELHHGEINVQSKLGEGTRFTIRLPLNQENIEAQIHIDNSYEETEPDMSLIEVMDFEDDSLFKQKMDQDNFVFKYRPALLLVEDNNELRKYLAFNLGKSYKINEAQNGKEGWTLALSSFPDMIVSDIMMPEMNGIELCSKLKNDLRTSHIPIILLTVKAEMEQKIEGLETGADAYIEKPFYLKHLCAQIKNLIENRKKLIKKFSHNDWLNPDEFTTNKMDEEFIKRTIEYIEENISKLDLNVENLSKYLCISRRHLYRKIKHLTGESPVDFIKSIKLKKGLELLKQGNLTVSEIGYSVGFSNPSYFTNSFKKKYGQSPTRFLSN